MPKEDQTQKSIKVAKATVDEREPKAPRKVLLKDWKREDEPRRAKMKVPES